MLKLNKMAEEDLKEVYEIEKISFSNPWSYNLFLRDIKNNPTSTFIVARESEKIIGYGGFWLITDEMLIVNLAIHPSFRNKGIGSMVLKELIKTGKEKGAKFATLDVRESNSEALNLYEKFGFKIIAIRKNYYADTNENAVVMWLNPI